MKSHQTTREEKMKQEQTPVETKSEEEGWTENSNSGLPDVILDAKTHGNLPVELRRLQVVLSIRELPDGEVKHFRAALTDTLLEVFEKGARVLGGPLLPPGTTPLDELHCRERRGDWSAALIDLDRPLWLALTQECTRNLGIAYVLAVKINVKWAIASSANITPRVLLTEFGFDPAHFSLYKPDSNTPLNPDETINICRGDTFEAQKDGRYGSALLSLPPRGSQTINDDIQALREAGTIARLLSFNNQKYVEISDLAVPSPPWGTERANILITVPAAYPIAGLDGFYIELPFTHTTGSIPYQSGTAAIEDRTWALISWHYPATRSWNPVCDDLAAHIEHCRGFFLQRGVTK
jgi:hypothetical protein